MAKNDTIIQNQATSIHNLEMQLRQLASAMNSLPQGALWSDIEANPRRKGKEQCKLITLRSGKKLYMQVEGPKSLLKAFEEEILDDEQVKKNGEVHEAQGQEKSSSKPTIGIFTPYNPSLPFP